MRQALIYKKGIARPQFPFLMMMVVSVFSVFMYEIANNKNTNPEWVYSPVKTHIFINHNQRNIDYNAKN
jgi:hypothetical protein